MAIGFTAELSRYPSGGRYATRAGIDAAVAPLSPSQAVAAPAPVLPAQPLPAAGITLHVDPQLLGVSVDAEALVSRIRQAVGEFIKEPFDAKPSHRERSR